ncbi:hypothetical protein [Dyella sedimenti]|uniref:hypothetical protein n=1 Tax=Dyella sedimenti TaxID=2919947 RepID=UPI001FAB10AF|nr:hypothetical protein [Dyella sedimenti]
MSSITITRRPIWLAIVITPLLTPLAFFLAYVTYFVAMGYNRPGLSWGGALAFMYLFGVPVGYVAIATLGWPWIASLVRWRKLTVGYVCGGSCIIGMFAFFLFATLISGNKQFALSGTAQQLATGLVLGLLSGLIFCVVAGVPYKPRN